jgi:hypothetical protein
MDKYLESSNTQRLCIQEDGTIATGQPAIQMQIIQKHNEDPEKVNLCKLCYYNEGAGYGVRYRHVW